MYPSFSRFFFVKILIFAFTKHRKAILTFSKLNINEIIFINTKIFLLRFDVREKSLIYLDYFESFIQKDHQKKRKYKNCI